MSRRQNFGGVGVESAVVDVLFVKSVSEQELFARQTVGGKDGGKA